MIIPPISPLSSPQQLVVKFRLPDFTSTMRAKPFGLNIRGLQYGLPGDLPEPSGNHGGVLTGFPGSRARTAIRRAGRRMIW